MANDTDRPLAPYRVVDLADSKGELCGRLLADLGADVIRVEPPDGAPSRALEPRHDGVSLWFAYRNAGKRSVELDLDRDEGRARLDELLATADVVIDSGAPGSHHPDLAPDALAARHPHLVVLAMTDFGASGPYAGYAATDSTIHALAGMVFKAGVPERDPLFMPGTIAYDAASVTAAFAVLTALWQGRDIGAGQLLDFSVVEAVSQLSDWSMPNAAVQVYMGTEPSELRQGSGPVYAIFATQGGYVRLVILSPRQWHAMREWLGEPEYLQDPELDSFIGRFGIADAVLNPLYEEHFATMTMEETAAEAQRRGIVCTPVLTPADVLANNHFASRGTFTDLELADGVVAAMPSGFYEIDGARQGPRGPVPEPGQHTDEVFASMGAPRAVPSGGSQAAALPLDGLRVMDFGHGGVGVEAGRMLAEYGAEVMKVESRTYVDFIRVVTGGEMSPSFASSSRSKKGLGINAKEAQGVELLKQFAAHSDIVIENNSTGTMDEMGLGFATLTEVNPGIVMVSSQLMGSRGEWSAWKGYGPNTQPTGGLVHLWDYEAEGAPAGSGSIFPDHLAGRLCAVGSLAALLARHRTGQPAHVEVAQIEVVTGMLGDLLMKESVDPGSVVPTGNRRAQGAPWGLYRCEGTERWIAITVADDHQWTGLVEAMGRPEWALADELATAAGRHAAADLIDDELAAFCADRDRYELQTLLQQHGVPAGVMLTGKDQMTDPHLVARGHIVDIDQQGSGRMALDGPAFRGSAMAEPFVGQAPWLGEHTDALCRDVLGLTTDEIAQFHEAGVLETTDPDNMPATSFPF